MMERMPNPFEYSAPVTPEHLIDRDEEVEELLHRAFGAHNSRLVAPRRFGKTSVLRRVLAEAEREGWATVYVNFFGVLTPAQIAERIEAAYRRQLQGPLAAWFSGVRKLLHPTIQLGGGPVPAKAGVSLEQDQPSLLERLALPRRIFQAKGIRTLVVFDEFQDVLAAGERIDAVMRSEIEQHADAASYIFAGSHLGMMTELFADKRRAFYAQAGAVELAPLDPLDIAEYVDERFRATSRRIGAALDPLLAVGRGHPQRTMLLAHWLWEHTPPGQTADEQTWAQALQRVMGGEVRDELRALWGSLTQMQKRIVALISRQEVSLFSRQAQRQYGLSRGGAVKAAVRDLEAAGEVEEDEAAPSGYRLVDPLLELWVREGLAD